MPSPEDIDFDRRLSESRAALGRARASAQPQDHDDTAAEGVGSAHENQVVARAMRGRLVSLVLDPRALRMPPRDLSGHLVTAVNTALDASRPGRPSPDEQVVDPAVLDERLRAAEDYGLRMMARIEQSISDAIARVGERTGMQGDPGPHGLESLLRQTRETLDAARGGGGAVVRGEGVAADGEVRASAAGGGRIASVDVGQATRLASQALAQQVTAAVNQALDRVAAAEAGQPRRSATDAALAERVRAVQDLSRDHMSAYTDALRRIMSSIQDPQASRREGR